VKRTVYKRHPKKSSETSAGKMKTWIKYFNQGEE
jgi:hypothetical protein